MAACTSDSDCRNAEGYVCDAVWKVCTLPGMAAPRAPACPAAKPLPRTAFGKVSQISTATGPGDYHFEPAAALTRNGDLVAVYIANRLRGGKNPVQPNPLGVSNVRASGVVEGDRELTSARRNHFDPWMARDRQGTLYAVWLGFDLGPPERNMQIGLATSQDGKSWTAPVDAFDPADCPDNTPGCFDKPMVAVGPDKANPKRDVVYVLYFSEPGGGLKMTTSRDGGKSFGKSILVGESAYADVEVDERGDVHVVATTADPRRGPFGDPEGSVTYVRSSDGGATVTQPARISAEDELIPFFFSNPQIVSDTRRKTLYVVYPAGTPDTAWDIMLATSKDDGATWTRIKINDDEHCANHMTPSAVLDARTGKVHVIWTENRGGAGQVAYTVCEPGGARCSANQAVSDKPFATYSFVRHSPKWQGEYNSVLIDPARRKLHVVWTQTVLENDKPRARIFHTSAQLR